MSRRGTRLAFAVVMAGVVVAAVAVERMTAASAQVGMQRAPARRVPLPTVPTRRLVTVRAGQGAAADTAGRSELEPTRDAPALLSRATLRTLVGLEPTDPWLDLYPRRPSVPGRGHIEWYGPTHVVTTANRVRGGYAVMLHAPSTTRSYARIHVRPQVPGARYVADCSVIAKGPLEVDTRTAKHTISAVDGHLLFIWETGGPERDVTEWNNYVSISSPDKEWVFSRCQLTFMGGPGVSPGGEAAPAR